MVLNFKNKIRHCEKLQMKSLMRSCKHTNTIRPIYREKQHCNVSKANIGLLEHVQCTCMSDRPKMSIPKFKYKLQTCKIKSSKLSSLIDSFRPFINQTNFYDFLQILKYG